MTAPRALLVALALLCGCAAPSEPPGEPSPRHNLILISLDALRQDRLGSYGYHRPTSPFLDELAARGILWENATVNTHGTAPSHATMLSGLYQETHRVGFELTEDRLSFPVPEGVRLLQEHLREAGYLTLGVTDGGNASGRFGFGRGFERFNDRGGGIRRQRQRLGRMLDEADTSSQPFFLFFHTYEVHSPYAPPDHVAQQFVDPESPSRFDPTSENLLELQSRADVLAPEDLQRISDLYDAGIRHTDDQLRLLWGELDARDMLDDTFVIVTSDHGEELGDHGGLLHRGLLYDELLRVPLWILGPGLDPGRRRGLASTVDVVPTALGLLGLSSWEGVEGVDLLARPDDEPAHVVSQYARQFYAVRTREWKLIEAPGGRTQLFDLVSDPAETRDVAEEHPDVVSTLRAQLRAWLALPRPTFETPEVESLSPEERRRLESLGYL